MASILNEYCLIKIFEYCDKRDYIALAQTCEQFQYIVKDLIRRNLEELEIYASNDFILEMQGFSYVGFKPNNNIEFVVEHIHQFVKKLSVDNNNAIWDIINKFIFAETTELSLCNIDVSLIGDACFPNLRRLELLWTGVKFKPQWSGVEHLVFQDNLADSAEVMKLFSQMKLKTLELLFWKKDVDSADKFLSELEEFIADPEVMIKFSKAFKSLPKLKKLVVKDYYCDKHYKHLISLNHALSADQYIVEIHAEIDYLVVREAFWKLSQLPNLRKIKLTVNRLKDIKILPRNCPMLKELYIKIPLGGVTAKLLTKILVEQPSLEYLQLEDYSLYSKDVTLTLDVMKISRYRTIPVTINLRLSRTSKKFDVLLSVSTNLIKITKISDIDHEFDTLIDYILE